MSRATDLLYPLQPISGEELLSSATLMTDLLREWEDSLPLFLKPTQKTLTGKRMFESKLFQKDYPQLLMVE